MISNPDSIRGRSRIGGIVDTKLLENSRPLLYFYGIGGQRIITPNTTVYQTFTLSAWVKWLSGATSTHYDIISKTMYYADSMNNFPVDFRINSDKKVYVHVSDGSDWGATALTAISSQTLSEDIWYHVAATYNNPNLIAYVNGESTSVSGAITVATNTLNWTIGNCSVDYSGGANSLMFKGWILDPRIYNIAKSKAQIINIKNGYDDQTGLVISLSETTLP